MDTYRANPDGHVDRLLNVSETSVLLNVSESWVRRHVVELPAVRVGRLIRFDPSLLSCRFQGKLSAGKSLKPERKQMLSRYQRGYVYQTGKRVKVWYGMFREDVLQPDGSIVRRQRNHRLGTLAELPTKATAREALRLVMGSPEQKPQTELTFSELVNRFEKLQVPMMKPSTGRYRLRMLKLPALAYFGPLQISTLTRVRVEEVVVSESMRSSRSVVRGLLSSLSQVLGWAIDHGWLEKNPSLGVKIPRFCKGKVVRRYLYTADEINGMVSRLREPYASLVLLVATTGLRIGEAIAIRHEDFSREGLLQIRRRILDGEIDTVKTEASERRLPIPDSLVDRLKALSRGGWVFQTKNGSPINPKNAMRREVVPAAKAAGVPGVNWHSFRHSFTVAQRRAGTPPKVVSTLLGHASVSTAMDTYDHLSESELRQPLDQLLRDVTKLRLVA